MTTTHNDLVTVGVELKGEIASAFKAACGDTLDSYASFCRKAVVSVLREEGYLEPLDTPRRHRRQRRSGATA